MDETIRRLRREAQQVARRKGPTAIRYPAAFRAAEGEVIHVRVDARILTFRMFGLSESGCQPLARERAMARPLPALDAFLLEHRRCGELNGGVEDGRLWIALGLQRRAPGQHRAGRPLAATPRGLPLLDPRPSGKHPEVAAKRAWAAEDPFGSSWLRSAWCSLFMLDACSRIVYALEA